MQQWLFVSSSGQQFTAHEPDVAALVQSGQITAQTLMWRDGMLQWMPAASVFPSLFASAATAVTQPMIAGLAGVGGRAEAGVGLGALGPLGLGRQVAAGGGGVDPAAVRRLAAPLVERQGWIKFLGFMLILSGIATLPMALLGLVLVFAGLALLRVAKNLERVEATGEAAALEQVHREVAKYVYLHGIFMVVNLVVLALGLALVIFGSGAALLSGLRGAGVSGDGGGVRTIEDIRFPDSPPPVTPR